jgi:two-component system chemotaxis response regulator CheY
MKSYALIADPDASSATLYAAAAKEEGLSYVSVRDGSLALAVLSERGAPELLVADIQLPRVPGFELIEHVRRMRGGTSTVVVVVSGDRDRREEAAAMRARLDIGAVLAKAASADSVKRVLKRLLAGGDGEELRMVSTRAPSPVPPPQSFLSPGGVDTPRGEVRLSGVRVRGASPPSQAVEIRTAAGFGGSSKPTAAPDHGGPPRRGP